MPFLTNLATAGATFGLTELYDISTVTVEIPAIKVEKTSDALNGKWIGDVLTYNIKLTNLDDAITATEVELTDTISPNLAKLIVDSVYVNGLQLVINEHFTYDPVTGTLVIPYGTYTMPEILPEEDYDVTFQVTKA